MYPIRFVLEPEWRLVAQHGVAVHVADIVVDDQVKHGQVEQSLKKLTFFFVTPCVVSCYLPLKYK
jgi:hypothetical protein